MNKCFSASVIILLSNRTLIGFKRPVYAGSQILLLIQTRFFSSKLKQICLNFVNFPISFISFSYCALTYLSSVAVALPCMYYIREEVKSEDFIWNLSKNSYYLIAKIIPINRRYPSEYWWYLLPVLRWSLNFLIALL